MSSKLFWQLDQIVRVSPFQITPNGLFPAGTDLDEVRQAVENGNYDEVRRLTGALR